MADGKTRCFVALMLGAGVLSAGCAGGPEAGPGAAPGAEAGPGVAAEAERRLEEASVAGAGGDLAAAEAAPVACPTTISPPDIVRWDTLYANKAVTLCRAFDEVDEIVADVQIVDFEAGGKMRVMSEMAPGEPMGEHQTHFVPRTAPFWHNWVASNVSEPPADRLFSVTNGSFFTFAVDDSRAHLRRMVFPQKKWNVVTSLGGDIACHSVDGLSSKRTFGLSDPRLPGRQSVAIETFDDPCLSDRPTVEAELGPFFDASVGYHPLHESPFVYGGEANRARRTLVGTLSTDRAWLGSQDRAYLLTSAARLTIGEARDILVNHFGTMYNMQLSGGPATQYYSAAGELESDNWPNPPRAVPEVLVVYNAP